jgi:hypothetical protein
MVQEECRSSDLVELPHDKERSSSSFGFRVWGAWSGDSNLESGEDQWFRVVRGVRVVREGFGRTS